MSLPRPRTTRRPAAIFKPESYGGTDCLDGGLKSFEITRRPYPHHAPALRAAIASQKHLFIKAIEKGGDKTMTPDPMTFTPRANRRPRPRKIPPPFNNLLDGNAEEDYHGNTLFRASRPVHVSGGRSVKPPPSSSRPSILILFPFRSIYSEKITPFQSIKFSPWPQGKTSLTQLELG